MIINTSRKNRNRKGHLQDHVMRGSAEYKIGQELTQKIEQRMKKMILLSEHRQFNRSKRFFGLLNEFLHEFRFR